MVTALASLSARAPARHTLGLFAAALWWGSLTTVCFLVAPLLFVFLPTPAIAGNLAAKLFTAQNVLSCWCGLVLIWNLRSKAAVAQKNNGSIAIYLIVIGIGLALLLEFGVAPQIVARVNHRLWHSVGMAMFFLQWCCATAVLYLCSVRSERAS